MNKILSNRLCTAFAAVASFAAATSVVSAFGDALPVIENGGTYINGLIAASAANSTITIPKGHYILDCPVVFDKGGSVLRGETDDPRDTVLDGNGQPNNVYVKGSNKRLLDVTVTNVVWVNDAAVPLEQGGVKLENAEISNCVVSGCRVEASQGWNRGGGIYSQGGKIVKTRVDHCGLRGTASTVGSLEGGGVHAQNTHLRGCQLISNSITSTVNKAIGYGGGLFASGGSVTNCLFQKNIGFHVGGGAYVSDADVYASSFVGNIATYSSWGAGLSVQGSKQAKIAKCRIEGNHSNNGAGIDLCCPHGYRVSDCLIRGNYLADASTGAGIHSRSQGAEAVVSNCVFEANTNTSYTSAFHLANGATPTSLTLRDCWVLENYGSYTAMSADKITTEVQVRNCLFARNQFSGTDCGFTPTDGHVLIESCSFLEGENVRNGRCLDFFANWFSGDAQKACAEKVEIRNVCVAGTSNGKDYPTWFKSLSVTNCTYCYETTGTAIPFGDDTHNVSGPIEDLQFADYANGNYAIGKKSILKDAGLTAAWMGDGSKKGVKDMGDGSYTVTKVMDYGVTISANNAHPRCKGDAVDIGCAEYKPTNGFILEVR